MRSQCVSNGNADRIGSVGQFEVDELFSIDHVENLGNGIIHSGPFFVSCDHGCAHGPTSHAVGLGCHKDDGRDTATVCGMAIEKTDGQAVMRADVFKINNERIAASHAVFAYVDDVTAFGTFFEIGYAKALGIPVFLASPEGFKRQIDGELWYLKQAAEKTFIGTASEGFEVFRKWIGVAGT